MKLEAEKQRAKAAMARQSMNNNVPLRRFLGVIMIGLVLVVLCLAAAFYGPQHPQSGFNIGPATLPFTQFLPQVPNIPSVSLSRPTTILFMGTDVVYSKEGRKLEADRAALNGRSDTMMLVFLNPIRGTIAVLHVPRDTEASIGKYGIQKINFANAVGGPDCARTAVSGLLDVSIDHYVLMNIQGLVELVNEIGGVTVEIPKRMKYMDWSGKLKIDLDPGWHTLTGNQSMGFVRFRHDDLGDIGRVQRQQLFLQAVARKMLDPRSWMHVPALYEIGKKSIQTDMSDMEMFEAINFAHSVPKDKIKFVMLPGQFSGNGDWIAGVDAKTLTAQLANPDEERVSSRRNISIYIENASSDTNLGYRLARALHKLGYNAWVGKVEPNPVTGAKTRIVDQTGNSANANMLRNDLGGVGEIVDASVGNLYTTMTLILGDDVKIEQISMSSVDAPYVVPTIQPPIVQMPKRTKAARTDVLPEEQPPVENPMPGTGEVPDSQTERETPATNPVLENPVRESEPPPASSGSEAGSKLGSFSGPNSGSGSGANSLSSYGSGSGSAAPSLTPSRSAPYAPATLEPCRAPQALRETPVTRSAEPTVAPLPGSGSVQLEQKPTETTVDSAKP